MPRLKKDVEFLTDTELWDRYIDWCLAMHRGFGCSEETYDRTLSSRQTDRKYPAASLYLGKEHLSFSSLQRYVEKRFGHR